MEDGSIWTSQNALGIEAPHNGNNFIARNGVDGTINKTIDGIYSNDKWITYAIKDDGNEFALFVNNQKIGTSQKSRGIGHELYIGGYSNAGTTSFGNGKAFKAGYANGYYRNLAIYDRALSDEEIENYSF